MSSVHCSNGRQTFVDTLGFHLSSRPAVDFCRAAESTRVKEFAKTWIGVNFVGTEFVSVKLYFTVYESLSRESISHLVGNRDVAENCLELMEQFKPGLILDPDVIGSGYTFSLKVSPTSGTALGFHARAGDKGVFRHFTDQNWFDKHYCYVSDPQQMNAFANYFEMPYIRDCKTLEIGGGRSHGLMRSDDSVKIVPAGSFSDLSSWLFTETERQLICAVEERFLLAATCGGTYCPPILKSAYFVARERVRTFSAFLG